jgi:hypothetical protein
MASEAVKRELPGSYSAMYPSRFMKADGFKGKKLQFTIKAIFGEDLLSSEDEATKQEWITQFEETRLEWVMNKTNAYCLFRMFGGDPHSWVGKRIVLFGQPGVWFGEKGEAIRVWGSPDLTEDLPITLRFLRKKKDRNMTLRKTVATNGTASTIAPQPAIAQAQPTTFTISERLAQIFTLLGWNAATQQNWLVANANMSDEQMVSKLEPQLDTD